MYRGFGSRQAWISHVVGCIVEGKKAGNSSPAWNMTVLCEQLYDEVKQLEDRLRVYEHLSEEADAYMAQRKQIQEAVALLHGWLDETEED